MAACGAAAASRGNAKRQADKRKHDAGERQRDAGLVPLGEAAYGLGRRARRHLQHQHAPHAVGFDRVVGAMGSAVVAAPGELLLRLEVEEGPELLLGDHLGPAGRHGLAAARAELQDTPLRRAAL